jgi:processive 1,2-diacylglycerol beta-glucosyltransferase
LLVVSASMGAGHDGAAREIAGRVKALGHRAVVEDLLCAAPLRIGQALRAGYEFQLRYAPSTYEATYRLWFHAAWLCPWVTRLVTFLTARTLRRWVEEHGADVVVSTYPLATLALGSMRAAGRLGVPVVNFVTDFGVHPLWVHTGTDATLTVEDCAARAATERTGAAALACGPAVSARFNPANLPAREESRRHVGLAAGDTAVLIVAGSWGVGGVAATMSAVARSGFVPVVVCGRDDGLRREVERRAGQLCSRSVVLGWTSEMPALMSACDALVENAGGLTALEALRAGLPVVSFDPIPGHGRENAAAMSSAGVSAWAKDEKDLAARLHALTGPGPERDRQVGRAAAIFRQDPAALVAGLVGGPPAATRSAPGSAALMAEPAR